MLTNIFKLYMHFFMMILMLLGIRAVLPMNIEKTKRILKNFKKEQSSDEQDNFQQDDGDLPFEEKKIMVNRMMLQGKMTKDIKDKLMQMCYNDKDGNKKYLRECLFDRLNFRGNKKEQSSDEQDNFQQDDGDLPF